jgi:hypothetical protein
MPVIGIAPFRGALHSVREDSDLRSNPPTKNIMVRNNNEPNLEILRKREAVLKITRKEYRSTGFCRSPPEFPVQFLFSIAKRQLVTGADG